MIILEMFNFLIFRAQKKNRMDFHRDLIVLRLSSTGCAHTSTASASASIDTGPPEINGLPRRCNSNACPTLYGSSWRPRTTGVGGAVAVRIVASGGIRGQ